MLMAMQVKPKSWFPSLKVRITEAKEARPEVSPDLVALELSLSWEYLFKLASSLEPVCV